MIIGYDRNPNAPVDRKVQSLMESVQLALNEHATDISQLSNKVVDLKVITVTGEATCPATSNGQATFTVNPPSGYKAVAAIGYSLPTQMWTAFGYWLNNNNTVTINIRNNNSSAQTLPVNIFVLVSSI